MNVNLLKKSAFLKKEDVGDGTIVTITGVTEENVAKEGAPEEMKWCLHVAEFDKPMVLNSTNGQLIAKFTGSEDTDGWTGKQIILYDDPSVSFGGKITGGIRARGMAKPPVTRPPVASTLPPEDPANKPPAKATLKTRFKMHPDFNTKFKPADVNEQMVNRYGVKLDELSEDQAKDALSIFDTIILELSDDIPF